MKEKLKGWGRQGFKEKVELKEKREGEEVWAAVA